MPLVDNDYKWFHSTNKLGGAKTASVWQNGLKHDLFDKFSPAETLTGGDFYSCVFFENGHGSITMEGVKQYISAITPSADTEVEIGLAVEGKNSSVETIADENTPPAGVTFSAPTTVGTGLAPADLAAGDYIGVWFKLTINPAAAAKASDGWTIATYAEYTE